MKPPFALSLFSLSLVAIVHAEETTNPSLIVRWTPAGGEVAETKVPEVSLDSRSRIMVPVVRGADEVSDPAWHARFDFEFSDGMVDVSIEDHSKLRHTKDHGLQPVEVLSATFPFAWNKEVVLLESRRGKLSFVASARDAAATMAGAKANIATNPESPEAFAKRLEATLSRNGTNLNLRLYNPTDRATKSVHVRVIAPATEELTGFDRIYQIRIECPPLSEETASISLNSFSDYPTDGTTRRQPTSKGGDPIKTPEPPKFKFTLEKAF